MMQFGYTMSQCNNGIPEHWLLLDTCSIDYLFRNCRFRGDIVSCEDKDTLTLNSNGGGHLDYYLQSKMKLFPLNVFFNEHSIGNIISFFDLVKVPDIVITLDSRKGHDFNVVYEGKLYRFEPYDNGLYYYDTRKSPAVANHNISKQFMSYPFLQTIEDKKTFYTDIEIKGADTA